MSGGSCRRDRCRASTVGFCNRMIRIGGISFSQRLVSDGKPGLKDAPPLPPVSLCVCRNLFHSAVTTITRGEFATYTLSFVRVTHALVANDLQLCANDARRWQREGYEGNSIFGTHAVVRLMLRIPLAALNECVPPVCVCVCVCVCKRRKDLWQISRSRTCTADATTSMHESHFPRAWK